MCFDLGEDRLAVMACQATVVSRAPFWQPSRYFWIDMVLPSTAGMPCHARVFRLQSKVDAGSDRLWPTLGAVQRDG